MRPDAISILAALLAVGSLELVVAQDAPEAHVQRPRWYFPQEVKRTIRRSAGSNPGSILNGTFDNFTHTQVTLSTTTPIPETSASAQPAKGKDVVVTVSVDPKNPEITHRITGTTTNGGEPTSTTTATTKAKMTDGSSTENTTRKSSEAASTDAETTSKQGSEVDPSAKASTTSKSPSTKSSWTTSSSDAPLGGLTSGSGNLRGGNSTASTVSTSATATTLSAVGTSATATPPSTVSTSATATTPSAVSTSATATPPSTVSTSATATTPSAVSTSATATTPSAVITSATATTSSSASHTSDPLFKVTSPTFSTPAASHSDGLLGGSTSGLANVLGESTTSSSVFATPTGLSSANKISSAASGMASSGSDLAGLWGVGGKSSTGNSTSATVFPVALSSPIIPVSVPASATSSLLSIPTPHGTTTFGDFVGSPVPSVDSVPGVTSAGIGSTALIPTASMPNGSLLPAKSTGIIPGQAGTNNGAIPTPAKTLGSIPVPHSPGSDSTSTSVSGTVFGSSTPSAPLLGTSAISSVPYIGFHDSSKVPIPTSHPASTPLPSSNPSTSSVVSTPSTPTTSTSEEVGTAKTTVEPQTPTEAPTPPTDNNNNNDDNDNDWMPSTILIMPTVTATENSTSGQIAKPTVPPSLPGSITPSNEVTEPPSDSILLQLGFNNQLPWSFVATTPLSSSQIFNYTPQAIENALPALSAKDGPVMFAIEPYYNWQSTGYNATIAIFYFARDKVDALKALKVNPNSALYTQASESLHSLMGMVDPTIPLEFSGNYPSGNIDSTGGKDKGGSDDGSGSGNNENTDGSAGTSTAQASSVGIGVGVVAGAAAYGAGMFWVARRYRKRKQLHQRSSSTVEQMSQGGSAAGTMFAAGGRAPSHVSRGTARSQMISAPVMAENSLGWN
ncbi:Protein MSB2 [Penicillium digitatum]|uniref:Protein MSB2 n=1 Tax=Penicillium digitatum TaxID=36651 RepID=A0A7T7BHH9_PENDI|nr:Protein MSB2 [Penicillium digitatum]